SFVFFFFFSSRRRHTRFSRDWSSDVCSSDLLGLGGRGGGGGGAGRGRGRARRRFRRRPGGRARLAPARDRGLTCDDFMSLGQARSEERRVGKECRSGGSRYH